MKEEIGKGGGHWGKGISIQEREGGRRDKNNIMHTGIRISRSLEMDSWMWLCDHVYACLTEVKGSEYSVNHGHL